MSSHDDSNAFSTTTEGQRSQRALLSVTHGPFDSAIATVIETEKNVQ